jgi:phospholipid-transporting ATPase
MRNTEYALGVVVYTGMDTKIMRNAEEGKIKTSEIEKKMNKYIIFILML